MKEAIDKDQIPKKNTQLCHQCKYTVAHSNLENLCPACYHKKKRKLPEVKLEEKHEHKSEIQGQATLSDIVVKKEEKDSFEENQDSEPYSIEPEDSDQQTKTHQLPSFLHIPSVTRKAYHYEEIKMKPLQEIQVKIEDGNCEQDQQSDGEEENEKMRMSLKRGYPELFEVKTDKCNFCSRKTGLLGFDCGFCKINFCRAHRLPQNHDCSQDFQGKCRKKLRRELISNSIQKKHKGKLQQI